MLLRRFTPLTAVDSRRRRYIPIFPLAVPLPLFKPFADRLFPKSNLARSIGVLAGGTAAAQVLLVLAAPLLTRLYTPEDFGVLAVYASLLTFIGVVASLRYELAIPLPDNDEEAANVAALCLLIVSCATALTALFVLFFGNITANFLGVAQLSPYLWLLPIGVFASSTYSIFNYWSLRKKSFHAIARTKLRQAVTTLALQIGAFKLGVPALLAGQAVGHGAGTLSLAMPAFNNPAFKGISWQGIGNGAKRYRRFPAYLTWDAILNTLGTQLPTLFLASWFGPVGAGLYALANRVLSMPASFLGGAIGQAFFANCADAYREGTHGKLVATLQAKLIQIGMPPAFIVALVGPDAFSLAFGAEWRPGGQFASWMAIWLFAAFVYSPLSTLFAVMERQLEVVALQSVLLAARAGAVLIGAFTDNILTAVAWLSIGSAICYGAFTLYLARMAGNTLSTVFSPCLSAFVASCLIASPIAAIGVIPSVYEGTRLLLLFLSVMCLLLYYWRLLRHEL
jgi:O-antigen/teichoic acid export membrane protein